jgi:hypothetical protein
MGESEARSVSFTWSHDPKPEAEHQVDLRDAARQKQVLEATVVRVFGEPETPAAPREIWPGAGWELAADVRTKLGAAWTQPGKFTAALTDACERYRQKNGKLFTPKVLREGLRQHDEGPNGQGTHHHQR